MSDCNQHPCPSDCKAEGPFPLEYQTKVPAVLGVDKDGYPIPITPAHGVLYGPTGAKVAEWRDGSETKPLVFPNLRTTDKAKSAVIVSDGNGGLWRLLGSSGAKKRLVFEAGAVFFEDDPSNKPVFAITDVEEATCSYDVAVLESCTDGSVIRLKRVPLSSFNNPCDQTREISLGDYVMVCSHDGQRVIKPQKGYMLGGVIGEDGTPKWGLIKIETTVAVGSPVVFRYTGSVQVLTVPTGATVMKVKCWGAKGSFNSYDPGGSTAGGGYTYAEFTVAEDEQYAVVVGGSGQINHAGDPNNVLYPGPYGFGGGQGYHGVQWFVPSGGGLSGVFTGTSEPADSERSRAMIIAGGGAGSSIFNRVSRANEGGNGTGTQTTMRGATCPLSTFGASGGGGYNGGDVSNNGVATGGGGTGFVADSGNNSVLTKGADNATANSSDSDYTEDSGNGLVVVRFASGS